MKNIQVIDGALNCTYSIFAATEQEFDVIFPDGADVEFNDDLVARIGEGRTTAIFNSIWMRPIEKKIVEGIHGTLFFNLDYKKKFYPTKKDAEMVVAFE